MNVVRSVNEQIHIRTPDTQGKSNHRPLSFNSRSSFSTNSRGGGGGGGGLDSVPVLAGKVMSLAKEKGFRVIGEESWRYMKKGSIGNWSGNGFVGNGFLERSESLRNNFEQVSSVRASKSDDKRLYIFTGTKILHLRCQSKEDRALWIEALMVAKDKFPIKLTSNELAPSEEIVVSIEKLRSRLTQEGISETVVKDCESIMLGEIALIPDQLQNLQIKHVLLLDTLRRLETVVDETKARDSCCTQGRRFGEFIIIYTVVYLNSAVSDFYSVMSGAIATDSEADNESRYGVDVETEDERIFFDTNDFMCAESLRSSSYRRRDNPVYAHSPSTTERRSSFSGVHGFVQDNKTGEKVAFLLGKWDEAMYYVMGDPSTKANGYDPMTEAILLWERDKSVPKTRYNLTPFAVSLNELTSGLQKKLPPTDSRLRPDHRHLENGEYELANAEKLRLEQLQRQGTIKFACKEAARQRMASEMVPEG
ncbi:oxysterol-binding family protein [Striga asiatica]|uniref:Oxysterol-binding family protein n=1 Tax=Striga asiatica TaxID=4170 RepID=A0A5A7RFT4_STRAF|nr:oxysterol-binding family protein [Striga asiatica]